MCETKGPRVIFVVSWLVFGCLPCLLSAPEWSLHQEKNAQTTQMTAETSPSLRGQTGPLMLNASCETDWFSHVWITRFDPHVPWIEKAGLLSPDSQPQRGTPIEMISNRTSPPDSAWRWLRFPRCLHPQNLTWPLKNDGWKMSFLLGLSIFGGGMLNLRGAYYTSDK